MDLEQDSMPVDEMIRSVQRAVARAGLSSATPGRDLRVGSVDLTLRVVAAKAAGAGLTFRVPFIGMKLSAGTRVSKQNTHTVRISLQPVPAEAGHPVRGNPIEDALADAISTIRTAMASAAEGNDPWALASGAVELEFAVQRNGRISLGAEGELANEVTHTLRLTLLPSS